MIRTGRRLLGRLARVMRRAFGTGRGGLLRFAVILAAGNVLVIFVAAVGLGAYWGADDTGFVAAEHPSAVLSIDAPAAVAAGQRFDIDVRGAPDGATVALALDGGYGPRHFESQVNEGIASFVIDVAERPESRTVMLVARSGSLVGTDTMSITAGPAVDPLDLYLGPRTVVADADHFTMIVAVPKDEYGNPVPDGTAVDYVVTRPSLATEISARETEHLLSWEVIYSGTKTGRTRVGTTSVDAGGPERSFLEVAGIPAPFDIELAEPIIPADGQSLVTIRSSELVDDFGNTMPDGTSVLLDAQGVTGYRRLRSVTLDGFAEWVLEVPDRPGSVTLQASGSGRSSSPLQLDFPPAVTEIRGWTEPDPDNGGTRVVIGPVRTQRNSYVPDGTVAVIELDDRRYEVVLFEGVGSTVIPDLPVNISSLPVVVLGHVTLVQVRR